MGITEFDNLGKELAEGRGREAAAQRAALSGGRTELPLIQRYVVLDTIFDPQIVDAQKLEYWEHDLGVTNIQYGVTPPRNAIIARRVQSNTASPTEPAMILYPFFPPNLSLPCKPGEHVWVMFEDPSGTKNDLGYWMCRIVTAGFAEDVNHTHPHRAHDPSFVPGIKEMFDGTDDAVYEFRNGSVSKQDGERYTVPKTATAPGDDDSYKKMMKESDGGRITHYEAVPRFRKRPADYVLEGTNNTLIVLGRDRTGPAATYTPNADAGQLPDLPSGDVDIDGAGSIDIVVGRGQTPETGGTVVENDLPGKELGKSAKDATAAEGDPDLASDRSRLLLCQRTPIDENIGLQQFNKEFADGSIQGTANERVGITDDPAADPHGDAAVLIKSDKIRIISRSDVEILVTGFERDENGLMVALDDPSKFAAVVIKANGDIVFRPAAHGYIKLGGDDADKGLLCTDLPVVAVDGVVSGPPLTTTMGGLVGGAAKTGATNKGALAPGQGKFASKVLVK